MSLLYRFTNEPSESENKEMDRLEADAAGEDVAAADGKDSPKVSALKAAVSKLNNNWVLTSRSGKRAAAMEMIKILRSTEPKVDLPTDEMEALQAIGLIITAGGKDSRPEDVIPEIVKKFSFAKEKAEKEAKRVEAVSETVKNPKNGSLIKAIHELSQLYYKEGTYRSHDFILIAWKPFCACFLTCLTMMDRLVYRQPKRRRRLRQSCQGLVGDRI